MKWVVRHGELDRELDVCREGAVFTIDAEGGRVEVELVRLDGAIASMRYPGDGRSYQITYHRGCNGSWRVDVGDREFEFEVLTPTEATDAVSGAREGGPSRLTAPIPGKVLSVKVAAGDEVVPGQALVVLEAMKMENELAAEQAGRVSAVHVDEGATVDGGELLLELE
jgi:acetyl/propionyl-CoA carboxylase alpha subunit